MKVTIHSGQVSFPFPDAYSESAALSNFARGRRPRLKVMLDLLALRSRTTSHGSSAPCLFWPLVERCEGRADADKARGETERESERERERGGERERERERMKEV